MEKKSRTFDYIQKKKKHYENYILKIIKTFFVFELRPIPKHPNPT